MVEEVICQPLHIPWPRRTPHQNLGQDDDDEDDDDEDDGDDDGYGEDDDDRTPHQNLNCIEVIIDITI